MAKLGDLFPNDLLPPDWKNISRPAAPANNISAAKGENGVARVFVKNLVAGQEIEGVFLVMEATLRAAKNGSKYVQAAICDKTGSIPVRQWDATEKDFNCYSVSGYVKVRGRVETYKNALQMIVFTAQECDADKITAADFLPVSARLIEEMEREFDAARQIIADPDYKELLASLFSDANVRSRYLKSPAASSLHHAWVSGLLEHTLATFKTAQALADQRPFLNRDLLLTGVLLHDIGKIEELDSGPGFGYTDSGRLCGHIALGCLLIERHLLKLPNFPKKKRSLILHMILSHHGELQYGSPVTPATSEATALYHLECLDAKIQGIQTLIEKDRAAGNENAWTDFARIIDGRIYKG
ncbi:MAG: HD domain-containing protein [Planctomycetota bacterium]